MVRPMALSQNPALQTLFTPFESGALPHPDAQAKILCINAPAHPGLAQFSHAHLMVQHFFKPALDRLAAQGYSAQPQLPDDFETYDIILLPAPRNRIETRFLMAQGLKLLKPGGVLVTAADNKTGGAQLARTLAGFGLQNIMSESRNKARVAWAFRDQVDQDALDVAIAAGQPQSWDNGEYMSWPGIYGWDKIDQGSALLMQHISDDLTGKGADFGCGYGYLGCQLLKRHTPRALLCIDADWRALEMCKVNMQQECSKTDIEFLWADCLDLTLNGLDFVVMNPPFHEGKAANPDIGRAFIRSASASLRPGGVLWMVANRQLPYEQALDEAFPRFEKMYEGQGFKILRVQK